MALYRNTAATTKQMLVDALFSGSHMATHIAVELGTLGFFNGGKVDVKGVTSTMKRVIAGRFGVFPKDTAALIATHAIPGIATIADVNRMLGMNNSIALAIASASKLPGPMLDVLDKVLHGASMTLNGNRQWGWWIESEGINTPWLRALLLPHLNTAAAAQPAPEQPEHAEAITNNDNIEGANNVQTNVAVPSVKPELKGIIDGVLAQTGIGMSIDQIISELASGRSAALNISAKDQEVGELRAELARVKSAASQVTLPPVQGNGTLPSGKADWVEVSSVFKQLKRFDFKIPKWTWDAPHPDVPATDDDYIFRPEILLDVCLALANGDPLWAHGHTGTGKTTLIEQVAASLGWPVMRVAFDNAIDRMELVGRMELTGDGKGGTNSNWKAGVLEYAIPNGYIFLCDELDQGRPDSLFVMQEVFERRAKRLLEDGGRAINFHPLTRIAATGNSAGNGDTTGLYPTCRTLSAATLDRFTRFVEVPYLTQAQEAKLLSKKTGLAAALVKRLAKFGAEMRAAFTRGEIPVSYSPRRSMAFAKQVSSLLSATSGTKPMTEEEAINHAIRSTVLASTPVDYRQRVSELARNAMSVKLDTTTIIEEE